MNSEEFRETFLRNDREGPTKAEKAGRWRTTTPGIETREEEICSRVLQRQERPTQPDQCDRLGEGGTTLPEKPKERQARVVKRKNKEKRQRVPKGLGKPQRKVGRGWPEKNSHRASKNRGLRRAL